MAKQPTRAELREQIKRLEVYQAAWMFQDREKHVFRSGPLILVAVALESPTGGVCWLQGHRGNPRWVTDAVAAFATDVDAHVRQLGVLLKNAHLDACGVPEVGA